LAEGSTGPGGAGALLLFAAWAVDYLRRPCPLPQAARDSAVPMALMLAWVAFTLFQAAPLPAALAQALSPAAFDLYEYALGPGHGALLSISIDREATLAEFLKGAAYTALFFLTVTLVNSHRRARLLLKTVVFVGLAEAVYGLLNTLTGLEYIWWTPKTAYVGFVTGTFVNRNHFAGHMELLLPLALGLLMAYRGPAPGAGWKAWLRGLTSLPLEARGRLIIYIVIMFAALLLSGSRGGIVSLLVALTLAFIVLYRAAGGRGGAEIRYAPFVLALVIIAGAWLGLGKLPERVDHMKYHTGGRLLAWEATSAIVKDYPVFGSGAGTFQYIFPLYEAGALVGWGYYDHAHNDYLELLAEQGVAGLALAAAIFLTLLLRIARALARRRDPLMRGLLFASFTGALSLLIHAIIDFNFHIPANAAYFYVILGLGVVGSSLKLSQRT